MRDYLELLLARRQSEDDREKAIPDPGQPLEFPAGKRARDPSEPGVPGEAGALSSPETVEDGPARSDAIPSAGALSPEAAELEPRRRAGEDGIPEEQVARAEDALARPGEAGTGGTESGPLDDALFQPSARAGALDAAALARAAGREISGGIGSARPSGRIPSEGAAILARRLSRAALASPPPAAREVLAVEPADPSGPSAWEEFDRRLERDARRYDGGVGGY